MARFTLFLIALVVVEVFVFQLGAERIGAGRAWALLLGTALLGGWMVLRGMTLQGARRGAGELDPRELILQPVGCLLSGVLLIIPGFLTDAVGLLLLIPPLRAALASLILRRLERHALFRDGSVHWFFRVDPRFHDRGDRADRFEDNTPGTASPGATPAAVGADPLKDPGPPDQSRIRDADFEVVEGDESARDEESRD